MKKFLIMLLLLVLIPTSLFATFSDEEFYEVYDQLEASTEVIEEQQKTIDLLTQQINNLIKANEIAISQIESSNKTFSDINELLSQTKSDLEKSNKKLNSALSGGLILGLNTYFDIKNLPSAIYLGANIGWKFENRTMFLGSFSTSKAGILVGLSYNILF